MRIRYKAFRGYKIKTMMVGLTLRIVLSYLDYPSVSPIFQIEVILVPYMY